MKPVSSNHCVFSSLPLLSGYTELDTRAWFPIDPHYVSDHREDIFIAYPVVLGWINNDFGVYITLTEKCQKGVDM